MNLRRYWKLLTAIYVLMMLYFVIMVSMFNPENMSAIQGMMGLMPKGMVDMMGMGANVSAMASLTGMMANFFYGFLAYLIPTIFLIITANGLVAKLVDQGSMANLLSTPHSRREIIVTQAVFLLASLGTLFLLFTLSGYAAAQLIRPGELDIPVFFLLNIGVLFTLFALSGLSFFFSCVMNESSKSLLFGAGIPLFLFLIKMISQLGSSVAYLSPWSIYGLFSPMDIVSAGKLPLLPCFVYLALGLVGYFFGARLFCQRNLPL